MPSSPKLPPGEYPRGMQGFFAWLRTRSPRMYSETMKRVQNPSLAGLGMTGDASAVAAAVTEAAPAPKGVIDKLRDMLLAAGQTYLTVTQVKAQQKVLDMNLKRAQQNLPPLDVTLPAYSVQGPQVGVGVNSSTQDFLMKALLIGGGILVAVKLIK